MSSNVIDALHPLLPGVTPHNLWALSIQGTIILGLALVVSFIVYRLLAKLTNRLDTETYPYSSAFLKAARLPFSLLVWLLALSWFLTLSKPLIKLPILQSVPVFQKILIILLLGSFLIQAVRTAYTHVQKAGFKNTALSPSASEAVCKLLQVFIFISTALILLQSIGISISGLLAFGGLGGLIVGFAAKDTLANLFSGVMLYMDRPFQVGEKIKVPGKSIEGTVEHIGWRQTRVRTYELQPVYVPNSLFGNSPVQNPSRMFNRRIRHTLGIRYKDFSHLPAILSNIKQFLHNNADIDQQRPLRVHFIEYGASSINFQIYCFTLATKRDDFLKAQEKVLLNIGNIIQKHNADFAFPTQTLDIDWPENPQK